MKNFSRLRNLKSVLAISFFVIAVTLIFTSFKSIAGSHDDTRGRTSVPRLETLDDPYIFVPRQERATSPAYRLSGANFFARQVNVMDSLNILGDAANEPSIAVDPTDPNRIAIGWRQFDTVLSNFRQAGYAFTTDGGQSWTFPGVIEPGIFRSDPVLDSDSAGTFYYNSLTVSGSNDYLCYVFKSTDGGASWDLGTFAQGGDKQWMVIDKSGGLSDGHIYSYWTEFYSICFPGFFTRSANHGASYEDCVSIPNSPQWGTLAVDSNGRLYIAGTGGNDFVVARSTNAADSNQIVSWDFSTTVSLDGGIGYGGGPNPGGLLGQTWIAVDHSNSPSQDNVYLLCSVDRYSVSDPTDVMFSRSTDGGLSWSLPVRVNDDPGTNAWQWFGTMSVAPNGRIDVVWLDTRDNPGTYLSSLYYAYSLDGGATWSQNQRLTLAFDPHVGWPQQNKMGDYFDMVSDSVGAYLAWAGTFNGEQDVYYGRITPNIVAINDRNEEEEIPGEFVLFQNYPNPFNPTTHIQFGLPKSADVKIELFTVTGEKVATLLDAHKSAGYHTVEFDGRNLASGVYLYRIRAGNYVNTEKMILLR